MRLLNVKTLELQEFFGAHVPQYVILSHRWENEEVTFQDFKSGEGKNMIGWSKIVGCCNLAIKDSIEYAWIDSCCIDKNSSAELSEAINSMFRWYRDAETCYAFLSDVAGPLNVGQNIDSFRFSKWFTRGWTLQELLAPDDLVFFDKSWKNIGTKGEHKDLISEITGIKRRHLFEFEGASAAQRMSWASKRETTRIEDQAYCLLGVFGVNMPPLYGEGSGAFLRLQLEILKISTDESLFAWEDDTVKSSGLLAPSPTSFKYASDIKCLKPPLILRPPYSMTHKGLEIVFELMETEPPYGYDGPPRRWMVAPLNCRREDNRPTVLTLVLSYKEFAQSSTNTEREDYQRLECSTLLTREKKSVRQHILVGSEFKAIHVKQPRLYPESGSYCRFRIITHSMCLAGWKVTTKLVLDPERGRWRADCHNTLYLKLLNSYAIIRLELSREANEYGDFMLLLS